MEQQYCNGKPFVLSTVNMERFAELIICGFNPMKLFAEILLQCLGQQCLLFNYIAKKYSPGNFAATGQCYLHYFCSSLPT